MALVMLVRHAEAEAAPDQLLGRSGPGLSCLGRQHAAALGPAFAGSGITHIFCSPERRALETAAAISRQVARPVLPVEALRELDYGLWTGRTLADLDGELLWLLWNAARSMVRPPAGESMQEVQDRIVGFLERYAAEHPGGRAVMVSHAEPIRAAALYCMSLPLDEWAAVEIAPAGVLTIGIGRAGQMVLSRKAAA